MTTKTKKILGVSAFIVVICVIAYLVFGNPAGEMENLADDYCACKTNKCRTQIEKEIKKLVKKYDGETRDKAQVDRWQAAQRRIIECGLKPLPPQ